jgi:hypothetical protein
MLTLEREERLERWIAPSIAWDRGLTLMTNVDDVRVVRGSLERRFYALFRNVLVTRPLEAAA